MEDKMNQKKAEVEQEFKTCNILSSCNEFLSCIQGLQAKFGGGGQGQKQEPGQAGGQEQKQGQESLPSDVQTKLNACIAEMKKGAGDRQGEPSGEGQQPPTQQFPNQNQYPNPGQYPTSDQNPSPSQSQQPLTHDQQPQSSGQIPQEYCSSFASTPKCEYVGPPDSQNYKYCKQCFPDK